MSNNITAFILDIKSAHEGEHMIFGLLSLANLSQNDALWFHHLLANDKISFFTAEQNSIVYKHHIFLIHLQDKISYEYGLLKTSYKKSICILCCSCLQNVSQIHLLISISIDKF
jgi:hypothetical protein